MVKQSWYVIMAVDYWWPCDWYSSTLCCLSGLHSGFYCNHETGAAQSSASASCHRVSQRFTVSWASMIHLMEVLEVTPSHLFYQLWKLADIEETGEKCCFKRNIAAVWLFGLFNCLGLTLRASTNFSFIFSCLLKVSVGSLGEGRL